VIAFVAIGCFAYPILIGSICHAAQSGSPSDRDSAISPISSATMTKARYVVDAIVGNGTNVNADKRVVISTARSVVPQIKASGRAIKRDLDVKSGSSQQKALILKVGKTGGQMVGNSIGSGVATDLTAPLGSTVQNYASKKAGDAGGRIGGTVGTNIAKLAIKNQAKGTAAAIATRCAVTKAAKAGRDAAESTGMAVIKAGELTKTTATHLVDHVSAPATSFQH